MEVALCKNYIAFPFNCVVQFKLEYNANAKLTEIQFDLQCFVPFLQIYYSLYKKQSKLGID